MKKNGDGVLYMNTGLKHAIHVVVSLMSLRDHWHGPVALAAGDDAAEEIFRRCIEDGRLGELELIRWDAPTRSTGGNQYANKCEMGRLSPFKRTVFLDADTLVVGNFGAMFPRALTEEVRLTSFSDWTTQTIANRIEPWRAVAPVEVARQLGTPNMPALNTGVIGFTSLSTRWFSEWRKMTERRVGFICDEIAAQLIFTDHPHCILDERWNASPVYSWKRRQAPDGDVRIWHGHGFKFWKKDTGRQLWLPFYHRALTDRIARIDQWAPTMKKRPEKYAG